MTTQWPLKPITDDEAAKIREYAAAGFSPRRISQAMRDDGFHRKPETVRAWMRQKGVHVDQAAARALYLAESKANFVAGRPTTCDVKTMNAAFEQAWAEHHGNARYTDAPGEVMKSRTRTPRVFIPTSTNFRTLAGVVGVLG